MARQQNRKHSIIDRLDPELKEAVEQMLLTNCTYADVVRFLEQRNVRISIDSVFRYARGYKASIDLLQIASENFRRMTETMDRTPNLDMGEALMRVAAQHVMTALTQLTPEQMANVDFVKLVHEASAMTKVLAYKKNVDITTMNEFERGLVAVKQLAMDALMRDKPDVYHELVKALDGITPPGGGA